MAAVVGIIGNKERNAVQVGDFRIDFVTHTATVRGRTLNLSGPEFDVLVFLISHKRRMVTAQTKLATKPERGGVRQTEFLPVLLSLRKKLLEAVPNCRYVHTEACVLYDFVPDV